MKWPRFLIFIVTVSFILIAVAVQIEKPALRMNEERPGRIGTHFRKVAFAPETDTVWAAGFGGVIIRSVDSGKTWQRLKSGTNARLYGLHVFDANTVYSCGSEGTVLFTSNGGKTWRSLQMPTRKRLVDVFFIDPVKGWVVGDDGILLKTVDGGRNWSVLNSGYDSGFRTVWFSDENTGYIAGYEGLLLATVDGGDSWNRVRIPEHISFYGAHFGGEGNRCFLVGSFGLILESDDAGINWNMHPILTTNFLRDIDISPTGFGCIVGYGVILTRLPGADQWFRTPDFPGFQFQSVAVRDDGTGIAVGHWGTIQRTEDYGRTWTFLDHHFAPDLYDIAINEKTGMVTAVGADGWSLVKPSLRDDWFALHTGSRDTLRSVSVDQNGRFLALGGNSANSYQYTPGEPKWERKPVSGHSNRNLNAIVFKGTASGFIAGDGGILLVTHDVGDTWTERYLPIPGTIRGIRFIDDRIGFVYGDNGLVMETRNGGTTWLAQYTGVTYGFYNGIFNADGYALLLSPFGALESVSGGHNASWFERHFDVPAVAAAPCGRYLGLLNGDILDTHTGVSRCVSGQPIVAFTSDSYRHDIWGAGRFGRIIKIRTDDVESLLVRQGNQ